MIMSKRRILTSKKEEKSNLIFQKKGIRNFQQPIQQICGFSLDFYLGKFIERWI